MTQEAIDALKEKLIYTVSEWALENDIIDAEIAAMLTVENGWGNCKIKATNPSINQSIN